MKETLKILVVDDEDGMRLAVARALRNYVVAFPDLDFEAKFEIIQAGTGEQALELIAADPPPILLLDHKLPGISGLDALGWIVERKLEVVTIMITAYASLETAVLATKLGAFDFLAKPFTPDELKAGLRKAVRHFVLQRQTRRLMEEKRTIRFQFLSVLAHELKAPLAAIEGYLFMMRDHTAGDDPAHYSKAVDRSLIRIEGMRKLIFDLLDLTRIESGQKKRDLVPTDVVEIARAAVETQLPSARERNIVMEIKSAERIDMKADRGEIEIILNNLVSSAVKYNKPDGRVEIETTADADKVTIRVSDTGIGMSQAEADKLFGEFVRIKNSKTVGIQGSGLGLSIVRRIARLYGGDVTVVSAPDQGSTFTVVLDRVGKEVAGPSA